MRTLLGCLATAIAVYTPLAQTRNDSIPPPVADHHAHLKSPAVARLFFVRYPALELPAELERVLRDFALDWRERDHTAMVQLFTEDGMMKFGDAWRRGRGSLRVAFLDAMSGSGLRFWAQQYEMRDSLAYIAGSYGHGTRADRADIGRLHLSLRKGGDGMWRIAVAVIESVNATSPSDTASTMAEKFVALLDSAGMQRAAVLSFGYQFGSPGFDVDDEHVKVRAENDWTAREAARHPARLVAFCSVNPVADYALEEVDRCTRTLGFKGLKLHFTSSFIDLRNAQHVDRLKRVFRTANARRFPMIVHMRTLDKAYGRRDAEVFLHELLPEAPSIPVQIAHVTGWGGFGSETQESLSVFADAIAAGDKRTANVYFDLTAVTEPGHPDSLKQLLVRQLRRVGVERLLFGLDVTQTAAQARERWEYVKRLPFTAAELGTIATNVAPYLRP